MKGQAGRAIVRAGGISALAAVAAALATSGPAGAAGCAGQKGCPYTAFSIPVAPNPGALADPQAVAIAPDGSIYVLDGHRRKVVRYSRNGTYLSAWGDETGEPGPFGLPTGIAVDDSGDVWVADELRSEIERFAPSGTPLPGVGVTEPLGISYDGSDTIKAASATGVIASYSLAGADLGYFAPGGSEDFEMAPPDWVFAEPGGGTVAVVGDEVKRFDSADAEIGRWKINQSADALTPWPAGVAESASTILVADGANDAIKLYTLSGSFIESWGYPGAAPRLGALDEPQGLAVDPSDGSVLVADAGNHRVQRFAADGSATTEFGEPAGGELVVPGGLAEAPDGSFWVASSGDDRVVHFDADGNVLDSVGPSGDGFGQLSEPTDVALAPDGDVYVADRGNNRVVELTSSGAFVRAFGGSGSPGELRDPAGIAANATSVFVVDRGHDRIVRFGPEGAFQASWGQEGSAPGRFRTPEGISLTASGEVLVADAGNYRLQRLTAEGAPVAVYPSPESYEPIVAATELGDGSIAALVSYQAVVPSTTVVDFAPDGTVKWSFGGGSGENLLGEGRGIAFGGSHLLLSDALNDRVLRFDLKSPEEGAANPPPNEEHAPPPEEHAPPPPEEHTTTTPSEEHNDTPPPKEATPTEEHAAPPGGGETPPGTTTQDAPPPNGAPQNPGPVSGSTSRALVNIVGLPAPAAPAATKPAAAGKARRARRAGASGPRGSVCQERPFERAFTKIGFEPVIVRRLNVCGRPGGTVLVRCRPARSSCPRERTFSLGGASELNLLARLHLTRLPDGTALLIGYANGEVRTGIVFNVRRGRVKLYVVYKELPCWPAGKPEPGAC